MEAPLERAPPPRSTTLKQREPGLGFVGRTARTLVERVGLKETYVRTVLEMRDRGWTAEECLRDGLEEVRFQRFRRRLGAAASAQITAVVTTVPPSHLLEGCLASLRGQSLAPGKVEVVEGVSPLARAIDEGIARSDSRYVLSVDDDFVLYPETLARLYFLMTTSPGCAEVALPLRDPILGRRHGEVHFYDADALRSLGPREEGAADVDAHRELTRRLGAAGWTRVRRERLGGDHHPVYLPSEAFWKFRRTALKARGYGEPKMFREALGCLLTHWQERRDPVALYGLGGLLSAVGEEQVAGQLTYGGIERSLHPTYRSLQALLDGDPELRG